MTCVATNTPIVRRGAIPVWSDVDPETGLINEDDALYKSGGKSAIVAVDWGGRRPDIDKLRTSGIPVIEDAAHRLPGPVVADYTCYSFQAIKHLTTGDGGALVVPHDQVERAKKLRWFGLDRSQPGFRSTQDVPEVGYKYQMNDIAATIGLANLAGAQANVVKARTNAGVLDSSFGRPTVDSDWWFYTMCVADRPAFIARMAKQGIECGQVHSRNDRHSAFRQWETVGLDGLDSFDGRNVAIPVGWWVDIERVADGIQTVLVA